MIDKIIRYPLMHEIKDADKMYAHLIEKTEGKELLECHLDKTIFYLNKIYNEKNMEQLLPRFYEALDISDEIKELFNEMCFNVFYMHDIGKANINFQIKTMRNTHFNITCGSNSDHSLLSSVIYIEYFQNRIFERRLPKQQTLLLITYMLVNAYIISKHHGHINNFITLKDSLKTLYNEYMIYPEDAQFYALPKLKLEPSKIECLFNGVSSRLEQDEAEWGAMYIYSKLIFSILTACDFYATSDHINDKLVEDIGNLMNVDIWKRAYTSNETYQKICEYKKEREHFPINLKDATNINILRSEMFLEASDTLLKNREQNLFYLEAPTGSGKTNTSIWLALTLLEMGRKNKLFYVFPFNALVEQTKSALDKAFESEPSCKNEITVINSITPIKDREHDAPAEDMKRELDYNQMVLDRQFFHYPVVITSHVQLFNLFFGTGRTDSAALYQLVNSVIILDEVQSYKNSIWTEIIRFLNSYAKLLNFKIVIMSATLPRLDKLLYDNPYTECRESEAITSLISDRDKYFRHPLFKDRVELDFGLLNESNVYEKLMEKLISLSQRPDKKILVEFIKKKSAIDFYNDLVNRLQQSGSKKKILLVTGDDSKWEREKCINTVKDTSCTDVILIATQLIEAGVDIDMDYGFKDISLLDAEEQFLGRINRSCKKSGCKAFFFNLDKADILYKGDHRKEHSVSLKESKMQDILSNKDFSEYYMLVFEYLRKQNKQYNKNNLQRFNNEVLKKLKFLEVKERMHLIEGDIYPYTVFLGIKIEITENGETKVLDGRMVWNDYMKLICNREMEYAEQKVKLSQLSGIMSCFMWQVKAVNVNYTKKVGDIFYIEDGEQYMKNGKFDRERFSK